jgi:UDP:flavonoid glycosyltransferase YjiC (YdhE family)
VTTHLVVALSAHGFGHIAQTAPIVKGLQHRVADLRVTVRTAAPSWKIRERFGVDVVQQAVAADIGMLQANAVESLVEDSALAYQQMHAHWPRKVAAEARALEALKPDLIFANIPYLTLAGAALAKIPSVAMCSLNWAEVYRFFYQGNRPEAARILDEMLAAYNSARAFLQPAPAIPMDGLSNALPIEPVAEIGRDRRSELCELLGLETEQKIVLVSLGGVDQRLPLDDWPVFEGVKFLVPGDWGSTHPNTLPLESANISFLDLLASCDALLTKPGYGSFVEAACAGVPLLYLERKNWPEIPFLVPWLERHGRCRMIQDAALMRGDMEAPLQTLWSQPMPPRPKPTGVPEAIRYLSRLLTS